MNTDASILSCDFIKEIVLSSVGKIQQGDWVGLRQSPSQGIGVILWILFYKNNDPKYTIAVCDTSAPKFSLFEVDISATVPMSSSKLPKFSEKQLKMYAKLYRRYCRTGVCYSRPDLIHLEIHHERVAITNAHSIVEWLFSLDTHKISHSGRTLLEHLAGVAILLSELNCDHAVVIAGLLHSIYGTEFFATPFRAKPLRADVRTRIGDEAEQLVYLFSVLDRSKFESLYRNSTRSSLHYRIARHDVNLKCTDTKTEGRFDEDVSRAQLVALLQINAANTIDRMFGRSWTQSEIEAMRSDVGPTMDYFPCGYAKVLMRVFDRVQSRAGSTVVVSDLLTRVSSSFAKVN